MVSGVVDDEYGVVALLWSLVGTCVVAVTEMDLGMPTDRGEI